MKRSVPFMYLAVLLITVSVLSCKPPKKEGKAAAAVFEAASVKAVKVARQKISEKISYTGTLEAWKKINIMPDVGGKIDRIYVNEGDRVGQGQVLAELDTRSIRLQLKQAEAGLAVAVANYADARRNKERMDRLFNEKAVSEQQYERVKLGFDAASAQLEQAQAAVNLAQHALDVSIMKAPFSGTVASKNAEVGDVINPLMGGFSPTSGVLTLMDFAKIKIKIDVSQNDIGHIRKGQAASVTSGRAAGKEYAGSVAIVNSTADAMTKKFRVEIVVENPERELRPGTFGQVTIEVQTRENTLVLPQKAILDNRYVFVAQGDKAVKREVMLGLQNANLVEVTGGVAEGDLVIVEGNYGLSDGDAIQVN